MTKSVLVLGVDGMVGNAVFQYLSHNPELKVFGTSRANFDEKTIFRFSTRSFKRDITKIPTTEIIINCIGALRNTSPKELIVVNTIFPKNLANFLIGKKIRIIHISTDAVFNQNLEGVDEDEIPSPEGNYNADYATSKLNGEISEQPHLTIRTSLLGLGKSGLLQNLIESDEKTLQGYENQQWSGCTTLQFARLCEDIILNQGVGQSMSGTTILHFAPIGPITKYEIVKNAVEVFEIRKNVIPSKSTPITRYLTSKIIDLNDNPRYTNSIHKALVELKEFYNK